MASGRVPAAGTGDLWSSWLNPTGIFGGVLAVLTCTFQAGVFLASDADSIGAADLAEHLRRRSLGLGLVTGAVALAGIVPLAADADTLFAEFTGRAAPAVAVSGLAGIATLVLLWRREIRWARIGSVVAVASVVVGWGLAQFPWMLVDEVTIDEAASSSTVLWGLVVASGLAAVLVVPPLAYLFLLADRNRVGTEGEALTEPSVAAR
ncbi:MAG: cytochrome d ubiquinol oxidase subunit II [Acidimicrobiales bacterium]